MTDMESKIKELLNDFAFDIDDGNPHQKNLILAKDNYTLAIIDLFNSELSRREGELREKMEKKRIEKGHFYSIANFSVKETEMYNQALDDILSLLKGKE